MTNTNVLDLFPSLDSIPDIPNYRELTFALLQKLRIKPTQRIYDRTLILLESEYSRLLRYILHEFMLTGLPQDKLAEKLNIDYRVVSRILNNSNLQLLFSAYMVRAVNEEEFFEQLKKETINWADL